MSVVVVVVRVVIVLGPLQFMREEATRNTRMREGKERVSQVGSRNEEASKRHVKFTVHYQIHGSNGERRELVEGIECVEGSSIIIFE